MAQGSKNVFAIDGVEVPSPSATGAVFQDNDISRSWDDINGIFRDKLIRYRKQVTWTYKAMKEEALKDFYINKIRTPMKQKGSRFFNITTPYPGLGNITINAYLGTPVQFTAVMSTKYKGVEYWEFKLIWTEVEGEAF